MSTSSNSLRFAIRKRISPTFELDASADIPPGITVLFGASGSGKTTLLKCLAGLVEPDAGEIVLNGESVLNLENHVNVSPVRRRVGLVFQDLALFPHLTARENIVYGLNKLDPSTRDQRTEATAASFHISQVLDRRPKNLSGGEQQRVALARALVTEPRALLLDEPLSALDPGIKSHIMDDLRAWIGSRELPVLYVTHNRDEVFAMAHRVIALEKGRIVGEGTPREVLGGAQHEAIAEWSALENIFEGQITSKHEREGTMTFRTGRLDLEVPLSRTQLGKTVRVGVSAHDILLAIAPPQGLSARNVIPGSIISMNLRDAVASIIVNCEGTEFEVYVTPSAVHSLNLDREMKVWVVIKTHSCFLISQ